MIQNGDMLGQVTIEEGPLQEQEALQQMIQWKTFLENMSGKEGCPEGYLRTCYKGRTANHRMQ